MIKVYEAKESLESMILGINKDPKRSMFDDMLKCVADLEVERISVETGIIPRFEIDGVMHELGMYPDSEQLASLLNIEASQFEGVEFKSDLLAEANTTRLGACCGVGSDVYLDPNED